MKVAIRRQAVRYLRALDDPDLTEGNRVAIAAGWTWEEVDAMPEPLRGRLTRIRHVFAHAFGPLG